MSHLRLVPPLRDDAPATPATPVSGGMEKALRTTPYDDPKVVALSFFQAASGICLCRACSMKRHPSYGG